MFCSTENANVYSWDYKTPTTCPRDRAHIIDSNQTMLMSSVNHVELIGRYRNNDKFYRGITLAEDNSITVDVPKSAFGLLKVEQDVPAIQIDFVYNNSTQLIIPTTSNLGTVSNSNAMVELNTGAAANSYAIVRSRRFVRYRPGQGVNVMFTSVFTPGVVGSMQLAGVGTDAEGLFFGYSGSNYGILRRSNGIDNWTFQNDWNVDRMDGKMGSSQVLDPSKGNVYRITYQWLGYGMLFFLIEDGSTGGFVVVHKIKYANNFTVPSMLNPSLPVRYEVKNTTNTTPIIMKSPCACAMVEGIRSFLGFTFGIDNTKTITSNLVLTNIITLRSKTVYSGKANFIPVFLRLLSVGSDGTKNSIIYIIKTANVAGTPVWTDVNTIDSVVEYDTAGTTVTGGLQIAAFTFGKLESRTQSLLDLDIYLDPGDTLTMAAKLTATGSSDVSASLTWFEDR